MTIPSFSDLRALAQRAGYSVLERVLWLYFAAQRPETPLWAKTTIYGALAYFVSPVDAVPDVLPGGYADDAGVLAGALATVAVFVDDAVREKAAALLRTWFGERPEPDTPDADASGDAA